MKNKSKKRYFPGQEESENIIKIIRRHWFTYVIFWLLAFLMIIPVIVIIIYWIANYDQISIFNGNILVLSTSLYLLFILALEIYGFINYYLDVYIITDRRIVDIKQDGFFRRSISELNLRQIQDVNAKVIGAGGTFFHYGDVDIQTAAEKDNFLFHAIPHPYRTSKQILELHEQYVRKERKRLSKEITNENEYNNIKITDISGVSKKTEKEKELEEGESQEI